MRTPTATHAHGKKVQSLTRAPGYRAISRDFGCARDFRLAAFNIIGRLCTLFGGGGVCVQ